MANVTLFDLACSGKNSCWSINPWKTRLALNYKRIPYETEWLEYTELKPYFEERNVPPNPDGGKHTIPTIKLGEEYITDSKKIISALEARYAQPSLHLDAPALKEVEDALMPAFHPLIPNFLPRVPRSILNPVSAEYFNKTRAERFGMPLDELEKTKGGQQAYEAAREPWAKMAEIVKRNNDGPFVLGKEVSYADFVIVSAIEFGKRTGEDNFKAIIGFDSAFKELYETCEPWLARDDH